MKDAILFSIITVCLNAEPNEILIGIEDADYPPFYFTENGTLKGICIDIVDEAASMLEMKTVYKSYPWKRMLYNAKFGEVDAVMPVFKTRERTEYLYYPDSDLIFEENVFFTKKGSGIKYGGEFQNLKPYKIGVVLGKSYGESFDSIKYFKKQIAINGLMQMNQFVVGRYQVGIGNTYVIKYFARKKGILDNIIFLKPSVTKSPLYVGFSKLKGPKIAQRFSVTIKKLKHTRNYQQILSKYDVK